MRGWPSICSTRRATRISAQWDFAGHLPHPDHGRQCRDGARRRPQRYQGGHRGADPDSFLLDAILWITLTAMTPRELLVPSELRQLRSQLSDALEASDGAISDEFDSRTRNEIRAEIARKSAALIHQARHGNWNAPALREALASWRLLKRLEENARPGGASSRSIGDGSTDFIWRRGERIFAVEVKSAPSGLTNIMAGFDSVAGLA